MMSEMDRLEALLIELRLVARLVRDFDYKEISRTLREAADTIESLCEQVAKCQIAELKADYDTSRYFELFGTPERAARTLEEFELDQLNWCHGTDACEKCPYEFDRYGCCLPDGFSLIEWLRGDA